MVKMLQGAGYCIPLQKDLYFVSDVNYLMTVIAILLLQWAAVTGRMQPCASLNVKDQRATKS